MQLLYDRADLRDAERRGDPRLGWLRELGAIPIQDAPVDTPGFLFGYQVPHDDFADIVRNHPFVRDTPEDRAELMSLEGILRKLELSGVSAPTPRTWVLGLDDPLPADLTYPLFVRTSESSWKRGGHASRVRNRRELEDESALLRRSFGWDCTILAREWIELEPAGEWRYGFVPVEIRVWIVDSIPFAWSFHYLRAVEHPAGFPPPAPDLEFLAGMATRIASPFSSRLIAADFVRDRTGMWHFLEAGPGACSGTAHEKVFKSVARRLMDCSAEVPRDAVGGPLPTLEA